MQARTPNQLFSMPAPSQPALSLARVLVEGEYQHVDLVEIYNSLRTLKEGAIPFVRRLEPFLSDQRLHDLTSKFIKLELLASTQAFRTSTVVKPLLWAELLRHASQPNMGRAIFLTYLKADLLPLIKQHWGGELGKNVNQFIWFNILGSAVNSGYVGSDVFSVYDDIDLAMIEHFEPEQITLLNEAACSLNDLKFDLNTQKTLKVTDDDISAPSQFTRATFFHLCSNKIKIDSCTQAMHGDLCAEKVKLQQFTDAINLAKKLGDEATVTQYQFLIKEQSAKVAKRQAALEAVHAKTAEFGR